MADPTQADSPSKRRFVVRRLLMGCALMTCACKTPVLDTKTSPKVAIASKCAVVEDRILIQLEVPHVAGMEAWEVTFQDESPQGLKVSHGPRSTTLTWFGDKGRVKFKEPKPYLLTFASKPYTFHAEVTLRPPAAHVLDALDAMAKVGLLVRIFP